jgi:Pyridoxamine 5'-phosphate oxidase
LNRKGAKFLVLVVWGNRGALQGFLWRHFCCFFGWGLASWGKMDAMITREFLVEYIRGQRLGVLATCGADGLPQGALVGIAVTPDLEIVFDTVASSRKYANLILQPRVALVVGWQDISTVQYEGVARLLVGPEDDGYREAYFAAFPDGRDRVAAWPDLVHFVVRPTWVRYSSFGEVVVKEEQNFQDF